MNLRATEERITKHLYELKILAELFNRADGQSRKHEKRL